MERLVQQIASRAQWLEMRRNLVTASAIGCLFDAHPHMSRGDLAAHLRGHNQGDNQAMRDGRILEPGAAVALAEDHPDWVLTKADTFHTLPDLRLGCTPDYWETSQGRRNVQIGTVSPTVWEKLKGRPPFYKTLQTLTESVVTDCESGLLVIMVRQPGFPIFEFEVPRHPAAERRILDAVAEWWRAWDAGEIAAPADAAGLDEMLDNGETIDLSADNAIRGLLEEREALKAAEADAKDRLKKVEYDIKNRVGRARFAHLPGWQIKFAAFPVKEHVVAASQRRPLIVKRLEE